MTEHWLVLGASSAIARAFVREVSRRGAAVTLAGRDLADLEASAGDARLRGAESARALPCDAADPASRAAFLAEATLPGTMLNVFLAVGSMPEQDAMDREGVDLVNVHKIFSTLGVMANAQWDAARLTLEYDRERNPFGRGDNGAPVTRAADRVTLRAQVGF